ncbi:Dual specificity mitogen-activated protein kinase kinase 6 [Tulasnella sp. 417]|nr:Dual specificity mitogen-activated protein kinase kinase 6 [Tulasnella sp. 417]
MELSYTPEDLRNMKLSHYRVQRPKFEIFETKEERMKKLKPYYDVIKEILRIEDRRLTNDTKRTARMLLKRYELEVKQESNLTKLLERMEEGHADMVGEATEEKNLLNEIGQAPFNETARDVAAETAVRAKNWQNDAGAVLNRIAGERDYPPLKGTPAVIQGGEAGISHRVRTVNGEHFHVGLDLAAVVGGGGFGTVFHAKRIGEPGIEYAIKFPSKGGLTPQISEAIEYLHHDKKVIHGDIKPANILLTSDNEALLCDFGLSKSPLYPITSVHHVGAGSGDFVAPAQRISNEQNRVPKNEESDIFAFGMTMLQVS